MIKLKNVSKTYMMGEEKIHALDNVTLNINKGDFISVVRTIRLRKVYTYEYIRFIRCSRYWRIYIK